MISIIMYYKFFCTAFALQSSEKVQVNRSFNREQQMCFSKAFAQPSLQTMLLSTDGIAGGLWNSGVKLRSYSLFVLNRTIV